MKHRFYKKEFTKFIAVVIFLAGSILIPTVTNATTTRSCCACIPIPADPPGRTLCQNFDEREAGDSAALIRERRSCNELGRNPDYTCHLITGYDSCADSRVCTAEGAYIASGRSSTEPTEPETPREEPEETRFEPVKPTLQIPIPGFGSFSDIEVRPLGPGDPRRVIDVPFLAQYIAAIYQYALAVIVTLASVMVVIGGLKWILARGDAGKIGEAKETITRAVMGLVLALGTYTILYIVNPELVELRALRIIYIGSAPLTSVEDEIHDTGAPSGSPGPSPAVEEGPGTAEDCLRMKELVDEGRIRLNPIDKSGVDNMGPDGQFIITRRGANWCYARYSPPAPYEGYRATFDDLSGGRVNINPTICKMLVDLQERFGRVSSPCIICRHARCGRSQCSQCSQYVLEHGAPGQPAYHPRQSDHWAGNGMDLSLGTSISNGGNSEVHRYVAEELAPQYGNVIKIIGPVGWDHTELNCTNFTRASIGRCRGQTSTPDGCPNTDPDGGHGNRISSRLNWLRGRPGHSYGSDLCTHIDHVHVSLSPWQ